MNAVSAHPAFAGSLPGPKARAPKGDWQLSFWKVALFIVAHVVLALAMKKVPILATVHGWSALFFGLYLAISGRPRDRQGLLVERPCTLHVAAPVDEAGERVEAPPSRRRVVLRAGEREDRGHAVAAFLEVAAHLPEPPQGTADPEPRGSVARIHRAGRSEERRVGKECA